MKYIGRLINIGYGLESTRGEVSNSIKWGGKNDMSFQDKTEKIVDESSLGQISSSNNSYQIKEWAEGTISHNIKIEQIGYILAAMLGQVSSTETSGGGAYNHTFTLNESNQHKSLTIAVKDPLIDVTFSLAMIESVTINANVGEFATISIDYKSKKSETATQTVSYDVDYNLLTRSGIFKIADNVAGLDAANMKCIQSFELTISKNLEEIPCLGSISPQDFVNKNFTVEGSFVLILEDESDKNITFSDLTKAIRLELIDTGKVIGTEDNPTLVFDLPKVSFKEWDKGQGNNEVVNQTITFEGHASNSGDSIITANLINETISY